MQEEVSSIENNFDEDESQLAEQTNQEKNDSVMKKIWNYIKNFFNKSFQREILQNNQIPGEKYCESDDDCVLVNSGCCGCDFQLMNKDSASEYEKTLNCTDVACVAVACEVKSFRCINNSCSFI